MSRNASNTYFQRLHAIDIATGAELPVSPQPVEASVAGTGAGSAAGSLSFDPKQYEERAALLLLNGIVYTTWTSHCDIPPYTGWVIGFDAATLAQRGVLNITPNGSEGAFWMAGGGPAADGASNFYLLAGNGTFETVTARAGVNDAAGKTLGVALLDFDDDGWMDLFVANDTEPNKLYRNNHNGTFTDNAVIAGVAFSEAGTARAGMGVDAADYDGSGKQSVVIGNFTNESIALYHNDGSGLFTDEAAASGIGKVSAQSLTFACFFFDYNLDGLLDVFAANGHVSDDISVVQPTVKYAQPPHLFQNNGKKKFQEVTAKLGRALNRAIVGRGAAYGDFDNDGDLDLLITTNNGPARLLRNDNANQNDVLRVRTIGAKSNRNGIGARVVVKTSKGRTLYGMVRTGSSYCSQSELPLVFGLGKPEEGTTLTIEITWPGNQKDRVADVKPNQIIAIQEGKGAIATEPIVFVRTPPPTPQQPAN